MGGGLSFLLLLLCWRSRESDAQDGWSWRFWADLMEEGGNRDRLYFTGAKFVLGTDRKSMQGKPLWASSGGRSTWGKMAGTLVEPRKLASSFRGVDPTEYQ